MVDLSLSDLAGRFEGLSKFSDAIQNMDQTVSCDRADRSSVEAAIQELAGRVDAIAARFPGNEMVRDLAPKIKAQQRANLLNQTGWASS